MSYYSFSAHRVSSHIGKDVMLTAGFIASLVSNQNIVLTRNQLTQADTARLYQY